MLYSLKIAKTKNPFFIIGGFISSACGLRWHAEGSTLLAGSFTLTAVASSLRLRLGNFAPSKMRDTIRKFINQVEWATPDNVSYLLKGDYNTDLYKYYQKRLEEMTVTKNKDKALRKIRNGNGDIAYTMHASKRKSITRYQYMHERKLRNCLARFISLTGKDVKLDYPADAKSQGLYFELDNGSMDNAQLSEKLSLHYSGQGQFRVVFWMSHIEGHNNEQDRLAKLFKIVENILRHKPNRILANTYTDYLKTGKLYNWRYEWKVIE